MPDYKHLLLTTDLRDETDYVTDAAAIMAKHNHAQLSIVHVLEQIPIVYSRAEFPIPLDVNLEEQLTKNARQALALIASRAGIEANQQFLAQGSVASTIIELAEELGVDLIIVGSHGHRGMQKLMGSTANAVLHAAKCDVLAVRVPLPR